MCSAVHRQKTGWHSMGFPLDILKTSHYNTTLYNKNKYTQARTDSRRRAEFAEFPCKRYKKGHWIMEKEYRMSAARAEELQNELNYLKTTRSDEVAEQIKIARGFGDLSENSEYDEAKNEQGKLYSRIAELEDVLQHVVIVDESNVPSNEVTIGSKVVVADQNGREMPAYRIVGSQEADPMNGAISEDSPFGKALLGAKEGDTVSVEAPRGAIIYTVRRIER